MKSISAAVCPFTAIFAMVALTACATPQSALQATPQDSQHKEHHPDSPTSQAPSVTGGGTQMPMMDMQAMCDMHKKMMSAKTPQERQSMMDERMKTMSPEMMQKHMQMMQEQCK